LQRWGIDIVVPLTTAQGNYKFVVIAVEYFTKWVEAKPLVNTMAAGLKRFFWQNIICQFRVPREITVDNAKQFDCHLFKDFSYQMGVEAAFTSGYHPQSNGAVEKANTLIFTAKRSMESQHLHLQSNQVHPFKLLYGEEPVTPEEIKLHNARTNTETIHSPSEAESRDLHEPERMKAVLPK
jgi:transposase InsO family protein